VENRITRQVTDAGLSSTPPHGISRYEILEEYAQGGGSILYLTNDLALCRIVMLKKLRPDMAKDESSQQRFLREARVTAIIQHPAVVPVYDIGRDEDGCPYFSMKRVEGVTLRKIIDEAVGMNPEFERFRTRGQLVDVVIRVAQAVAFAHEHGVIHRDIKPSNVIIGDFGEVFVMDWGVAHVEGDGKEDASGRNDIETSDDKELTAHGSVYGTPLYMAPEQARGECGADPRSDVFSLGSLLYESLTYRPLVVGLEREEIIRKIQREPFIPPRKREPMRMIPVELEAICMKALERETGERYADVKAMIDDLQRCQRGDTVKAMDESSLIRARRWIRKRLSKELLVAFLLGCLCGYALTWGKWGVAGGE
jgi:serine/threonine protein kinase